MDEEPSERRLQQRRFLSGDGEIAVDASRRIATRPRRSRPTAFGGETRLENWDFDYSASYAYAEEHEKDTQDPTLFAAGFEDPGALGIRLGLQPTRDLPRYSIFEGAGRVSSIPRPTKSTRSSGRRLAEDEEITLKFDAARHFQLSNGELEVKFGASLRQRTKELTCRPRCARGLRRRLHRRRRARQPELRPVQHGTDDEPWDAVRAFNNANLDRFELNEFDTIVESNIGDFQLDEDISAAYLMGTWRSGNLTVIGGVRVEDTENDVRANRTEIFEEARS
jgi:outer membrane receptor protein involved in Fe transport